MDSTKKVVLAAVTALAAAALTPATAQAAPAAKAGCGLYCWVAR